MTLSVPGRAGGGKRGDLGCFQQGRELLELLGVGGLVLLDRGAERYLVGVDDLLLVAGLDGEVDPGTDALRLARANPFDLLILDVVLPDIDGFEIVRRLRREGNLVPVIFLTAKDTQDDKVTGLTIGGDDYMTKPFGLEELAARVRTVLRRTRPVPAEPVLTRSATTAPASRRRRCRTSSSASSGPRTRGPGAPASAWPSRRIRLSLPGYASPRRIRTAAAPSNRSA
jgi:CheY-like chemotaxis protein